MKHHLTILLALCLSLPLAAADGVDASVDYLEADGERCTASESENATSTSQWYSDPYGYSYWWSDSRHASQAESCSETFTTAGAAVSADGVGGASAAIGGDDGSHQNDAYHESGYGSGYGAHSPDWYYSSHNSHDDRAWSHGSGSSWSRSAEVDAAGHSASAGRGCGASSTEQGSSTSDSSSSSWTDGSSSSSHTEGTSSSHYESRCYDGVVADGASAGRVDRCSADTSGRFANDNGDWGGEQWSSWNHESDQESACRNGFAASAAGESLFAGSRNDCVGESHGAAYGNESFHYNRYSCQGALFAVDGPDGVTFGIGHRDESSQRCQNGECEDGYASSAGVFAAWEHSPLGPAVIESYQPLP